MASTQGVPKRFANRIFLQVAALAAFYLPFFTGSPVNESIILLQTYFVACNVIL